jgi:Methyltransferase domain
MVVDGSSDEAVVNETGTDAELVDGASVALSPGNRQEDPRDVFVRSIRDAIGYGNLSKVVLSKFVGEGATISRITVRPVSIRSEMMLSFVTSFATNDVTKNASIVDGLEIIRAHIETSFAKAHCLTLNNDIELGRTKRGAWALRKTSVQREKSTAQSHDREKSRYLSVDSPFLVDLGITDGKGNVVGAMSRKWKQINKFAEVLDDAISRSPLRSQETISAVDFGAGKGYLTFALFDLLKNTLKKNAHVVGVELRESLVTIANEAAQRPDCRGLTFVSGDIASFAAQPVDVMVALHACDTATDHAIHYGITSGASIIVCSPCCHKELRPQIRAPKSLAPVLRHGVHRNAEAEMVTDAMRALLLEKHGYETTIFEFISPEETSKNKLILAIRRGGVAVAAGDFEETSAGGFIGEGFQHSESAAKQLGELKTFYRITQHTLETLLAKSTPEAGESALTV